MGEAVAKSLGVEKAQITVEDSVDGILKRVSTEGMMMMVVFSD